MSLKTSIQHNQSFYIAAAISILGFAGILGCHLTQLQKKAILSTGIKVAESTAEGSPLPWSEIGLAIGTILGSGAIIDNRRKDVLINQLKKENAQKDALVDTVIGTKGDDPTQ
jgi:hypothetical protein